MMTQKMERELNTLRLIISGRYDTSSKHSENQEQHDTANSLHIMKSLIPSPSPKARDSQHLPHNNHNSHKDQANKQGNTHKEKANHDSQEKDTEKDQIKNIRRVKRKHQGLHPSTHAGRDEQILDMPNPHRMEQQNQVDENEKKEQAIKILNDKYRTFVNWDLRKSLPRVSRVSQSKMESKPLETKAIISATMNFSSILSKKQPLNPRNSKERLSEHKKSQHRRMGPPEQRHNDGEDTSETMALREIRRERFLKQPNPIHILKHYMEKENFVPTEEQKHIIERLLIIQRSIDNSLLFDRSTAGEHDDKNKEEKGLEELLQGLYGLMNLAVDYNELLFLALLVCLAADICFFMKDYPRAFYFYNQARIAGSYAKMDKLKIPALMGLGRVCYQLCFLDDAKIMFRKALQYAWRKGDQNTQLEIYDNFGLVLNQKGNVRESFYYHEKYARNSVEPHLSALKKISNEMLDQYERHIESLEDSNLNSLFLEYIHLPLNKTYDVKSKQNKEKKYKNYTNGASPRLQKEVHDFSRQSFPDVKFQLQHLVEQDYEFKTEIPDPDKPGTRQLRRLFSKSRYDQFDGKKRELDFEHSIEFNKIVKKKILKPNIEKELKKPLDEQVKGLMEDRLDPNWYEQMVTQIKKRRVEKMGDLKERVRNSHLSYSKFPNERKKQNMWSLEKINESFNRTFLDWIDPLK